MRALCLIVSIAVTSACSGAAAGRPAEPQGPPPGAGIKLAFSDKPVPLPDFSLTDLDGKAIDRSAWRGKVVLLNFWATWCGPCRAEIPDLIALQAKYPDQLVVVGLSVDEGPVADVKKYVLEHQINYPVAVVDEHLEGLFGGVRSIPSTFVVNADGAIVQRHVGTLRSEVTEQEVRSLAKLPTAAEVEIVKDTGQVLRANAAYATEIPDVDLSGLTPAQKAEALKRLNTEMCTCGCGSTLATCRIEDSSCQTSLPLAKKVVAEIRGKK